MILSHQHKFLFVAIPKTGTHALRFALRVHLDAKDEEQVGLFVQKKFSNETIANVRHGHIKGAEIKAVIDNENWRDYFKFAVVRNPFDRYISFCAFMNRDNFDFQLQPQKYVHSIIDRPKVRQRILFRPQHEFVCNVRGDLLLDFIGKYEQLQQDYDRIAEHIRLPSQVLRRINSSKHEHYSFYYDDELREKVYDFYKDDFDLFNYKW
jgi:hypothetical protein